MAGPVQVVYDNRPRLSDAFGDLANVIRQGNQQESQQNQQQALAIMHYMAAKSATPQQWAQTRQHLQESNPEIADLIPDIGPWDPTAEDNLSALITKLTQEAADRIAAGKGTQQDYMLVYNQKAIGTEGGLKNTMYDRLNQPPASAPPPTSNPNDLVGTQPQQGGDLASILSGAGAPPPPPDLQHQAATNAFGITQTADQQTKSTETNRHNVADEGFQDRRATAYEGAEGARGQASLATAGHQNALTEYTKEGMDPNSGRTQTQIKIRQSVPPKTSAANDPIAIARKRIADLNKAADAADAKAAASKNKDVAQALREQATAFRSRAVNIQNTIGPQAPVRHVIMGRDGSFTPLNSAPPPPDDEEDQQDQEPSSNSVEANQ